MDYGDLLYSKSQRKADRLAEFEVSEVSPIDFSTTFRANFLRKADTLLYFGSSDFPDMNSRNTKKTSTC